MRRIMMTLFLILPLLLLASCSSLPLPGSPTESLFIFIADLDRSISGKEGKKYYLESVRISLKDIHTEEGETFSYSPGETYHALPVEPGRYEIEREITLSFKDLEGKKWEENQSINSTLFLIEKNVVYICPMILHITERSEGSAYSIEQRGADDHSLMEAAMGEIKEEGHYKAWDLFPVIGLEPAEEASGQ